MSEIRVNTIVAAEGTSAPNLPYGVQVPTGMGITGAGGLNISGVCTAGIVTATSLYGALTGNVTGNATGLTGTPNISCGTIAGSTGTFSGAVNVDATTDSTSTTTGALIVDGGAAIAKNVYIGAGLSVAGTLTYEDVTSVDSVGMVTAKSGVNVSGGQLQVGVAYSVGAAGVATAAGFVGPLTGNVTGDIAGNATSGLSVSGGALQSTSTSGCQITGGEFKVGTGVTIASTSGVATFSNDVVFNMANGSLVMADQDQNYLFFGDSVKATFGNSGDLDIYHDGSHSYIEDGGTGHLYIESSQLNIMNAAGSEYMAGFTENGSASLFYDNSNKVETSYEGVRVSGMMSASAGLAVTGGMWEGAFIKAGKLTDNKTIGISTSNIFVFTTAETTTGTPNIVWNDTYALSSKMKVGDAVTVTVITTAAAAGYAANWTVDGNAVSEQWNGGSAPSAGGDNGYDVYTLTLVRNGTGTGDSGWIVFANVSNFT